MKTIELIGANGAGKTTLYKALLREDRRLLGREEALYQCVRYWVAKDQAFPKRVLANWSLSIARTAPWAKAFIRTVARRHAAKQFHSNVDLHARLIGIALKMATENEKHAIARLNALGRFRDVLDECVLFETTPVRKWVLKDESLFHMVYGLSSIEHHSAEMIRAYTWQVQEPAAVIHVTTDADNHVENVLSRARSGHVMPGHRNIIRDKEAIRHDLSKRREMDQIVLDGLLSRGIPCVRYQSRVDDPSVIASKLEALLK